MSDLGSRGNYLHFNGVTYCIRHMDDTFLAEVEGQLRKFVQDQDKAVQKRVRKMGLKRCRVRSREVETARTKMKEFQAVITERKKKGVVVDRMAPENMSNAALSKKIVEDLCLKTPKS
jgi:hypothetical protein